MNDEVANSVKQLVILLFNRTKCVRSVIKIIFYRSKQILRIAIEMSFVTWENALNAYGAPNNARYNVCVALEIKVFCGFDDPSGPTVFNVDISSTNLLN